MSMTREDIAAFADGQLEPEREAEIAAAVEADPALAEEVARHRALKAMLQGHYAPIAQEPVPERLSAMLHARPQAEVIDFAAASQRREEKRRLPGWGWVAGTALAASLAIAVFLPRGSDTGDGYADTRLASVLDRTLVAQQPTDAETRILLSFRNGEAEFCRAFSASDGAGIACRDDKGWKLEALGKGSEGASTDYRMAGAGDGDILAIAQELAAGPALDAQAEQAAREAGWR